MSTRELALLAGVAPSTVSRVEQGHTAPRRATVAKVARPLGAELESGTFRPIPMVHLTDLSEASTGMGGTPDWTRLRGFADQLHRHPELSGVAIATAPPPSGSPLVDNLLAGIAEKVADDAGLRRPRWTSEVPSLPEPWEAPGTPRMRQANADNAAAQFAARNVVLPATAIWRERT